jgi:histidinol-phosphate aminotransferase
MQQNAVFTRRTFARALGAGAIVAAIPPQIARAASSAEQIRLSANENPFGPSPAAMRAMTDALRQAARYPDELADALTEDVAHLHGLSANNVILGDGSSDILRVAAAAFSGPGKTLVTADPTFEAIGIHARAVGANVVRIPLTSAHAHDLDKMRDAALVYICNPNNPTATTTPKAAIRAYLDAVPRTTAVLVDEAYHHYATSSDYDSVMPLVASHPNLIVARTFSKVFGMAGIRCGYAVAQKEMIDKLRDQQQWDAMNVVALAGARASLRDAEHVATSRKRNSDTKAWLAGELQRDGFAMLPSDANFVMIEMKRNVKPLLAAMRDRGVHVGRLFPAMPTHMRVTIGTPEEMQRFVSAFRSAVSA